MGFFGKSYELIPLVGSTNNYAAECVLKQSMADGAAILSFNQQIGRGQRDKTWMMTPSRDLAVTYYIKSELAFEGVFVFNKAICLAVCDFLTETLDDSVAIKWPNDLFYGHKKVAGLLIEPTWAGDVCKHLLVGLGLNVNGVKTSEIPTAISMTEIVLQDFDLLSVFKNLNIALDVRHAQWMTGDWSSIERDYKERLYLRGEVVRFEDKMGTSGLAEVQDVDRGGRIELRVDGELRAYAHGEVSIKAQS
jgi:BirA family biotin operon repressor/biotin-[acetyl-CoA-carboxylase] ligase